MTPRSDQATLPAQWRFPSPRAVARWLLGLATFRHESREVTEAIRLPLDGILAFRPGRGGLALRCDVGVFLVTQEGDPDDHVLERGDTFRTSSPGRVVAWAFQAGVLIGPARR
jgi:hypothetical protein